MGYIEDIIKLLLTSAMFRGCIKWMLIIPLKMPKIQSRDQDIASICTHQKFVSLKPVVQSSFQVKGLLQKLCMELMLTCKHSVRFLMESITSESVDSGQKNISPLSTNAYSRFLHIRSDLSFFQIQYCFETVACHFSHCFNSCL